MDAKKFSEKVNAKVAEYKAASAEATANMTESEKEAFYMKLTGKAKGEVKAEEKAEALKLVLDIVKTVASDDPAAMNAVESLTTRRSPRFPVHPARRAVPRSRLSGPRRCPVFPVQAGKKGNLLDHRRRNQIREARSPRVAQVDQLRPEHWLLHLREAGRASPGRLERLCPGRAEGPEGRRRRVRRSTFPVPRAYS